MEASADRFAKLASFSEAGEPPYGPGSGFEGRRWIADILEQEDAGAEPPAKVVIAGRVTAHRDHGNSMFVDLRDATGRCQVYLQKKRVGPERYQLFRNNLDLGDFLSIEGDFSRTRKGEDTVFADGVRLLTKSMLGMPKEHYGLADIETRLRKRYVDLAANPESLRRFAERSAIVAALRRRLEGEHFLEVETPMLHPIAGGAAARPFVTHHNTLDLDLYLRIAPELYLKRLLVGGFERVFEIGRNFRNEGLSPRHNPEFTMLEAYWAYARGDDWMSLCELIIAELVRDHGQLGRRAPAADAGAVEGAGGDADEGEDGVGEAAESHELLWEGSCLDMSVPFARRGYGELLLEHAGVDVFDDVAVAAAATKRGIETKGRGTAKIADDLFSACVEPHLEQPTFVTDFPVALSPLAKASPEDGRIAERFELFIGRMEVANGFSELNDPAEQLARFEEQVSQRDPELPAEVDHDYVEALSYGMPPAAGIGIGVDRLVMLLTGTPTIRDVILFPLLRPHDKSADGAATERAPEETLTDDATPGGN